ncbi:MAG: nuclear transport factor 2 family protein [Anaerolineales bacterium]|nr:nuclear transport factor 2 family protein [Anaerolineales bacterium]
MNGSTGIEDWMNAYIEAWRGNDPAEIGALFAADAEYFTAPFRQPWQGRQAIVAGWLERKDEPGSWSFVYEILIDGAELSVVEGVTEYTDQGRTYSNLWLVWLNSEGRCRRFVEYFMLQE